MYIVDTNILMNNPNIFGWQTSLANPVYIISDILLSEIATIHTKKEASEKARVARDYINKLHDLGNLKKGINLS